MGLTDYIKTRLLNNRVEQYNTKRSYWGEDERQPRTDGINTGLDLVDALPPVINKTIANARYAVKLDGYTSGILKNLVDYGEVIHMNLFFLVLFLSVPIYQNFIM